MATITSSLERSLRNCSLSSTENGTDSPENHLHVASGAAVDLNSQISLPYHWEQYLDLKTGEVYYINWKTGEREKEDPRTTGDFYSEADDDDEGDEYSSYDDNSEQSSSESSPTSYSRDNQIYQYDHENNYKSGVDNSSSNNPRRENVLVVAGCKSCLMYFMVPKQDPMCPKCCGQLLHFDQSENGSV